MPGAAVTFTIVNEGSATVNLGDISAIRVTGSNAAEFSASGSGQIPCRQLDTAAVKGRREGTGIYTARKSLTAEEGRA